MILETYQEQQAIIQPDPPGQSFATVGTVYEDGIALIFNGAETESLKHYKCNTAVRFAAGQRVRIIEDSGTYVVEYPVGAPAQSIYADSAARAAYASEAGYAEIRRKSSDGHKGRHCRQRRLGGYSEKSRDCRNCKERGERRDCGSS